MGGSLSSPLAFRRRLRLLPAWFNTLFRSVLEVAHVGPVSMEKRACTSRRSLASSTLRWLFSFGSSLVQSGISSSFVRASSRPRRRCGARNVHVYGISTRSRGREPSVRPSRGEHCTVFFGVALGKLLAPIHGVVELDQTAALEDAAKERRP